MWIAIGDSQHALASRVRWRAPAARCGPLYRLIDAGKLPGLPDSTGLGDVVNGVKPGRSNERERVIFFACGVAVFDISWGYEVLQNAREKGIGQTLNLWDKPAQG